ncbi:hypothetical protein HB364_27635 [Pseudoflavitalea sp. X16]|uniref:hypothetical protein n=1 Tax=Paraflavitalea devenefica TaxID=2716334 RepID=UPI0014243A9B|nr:hypothetical protein [Paraflavitalea devenefica]NII28881.1 hypothetical protein [Paraflavitalea devenefica]
MIERIFLTSIPCLVSLKLRIGLVVLALHFVTWLSAQTGGHGKFQIFAPNTFEFARYGDVPVDLSSGVTNINVPLTTLVDKDISLDISLSYNASGIKVDQEATWVGLGWVLNCGGVITREVRGIADGFNSSGVFISRTSIPDHDPNSGMTAAYYADNIAYGPLHNAANNVTDNGADIFYYNFNGRSGKFFLDNDKKAVFTKYEDLKVSFEPVLPGGYFTSSYFVITDERGFKYEFKDEEITSSVTGGPTYTSAWYLSKITSPAGGSITIQYVGGGMSTYQFQKRCFDAAWVGTAAGIGEHLLPQQYTTACITYEAGINGIVPQKITTSAGNSLELVTATALRLDSEPLNNNQLNSLIVRDYLNNEVRRFNFSYGYFEANDSRKFPVVSSSDNRKFLDYRLRLDTLWEVSPTGVRNAPYIFGYYGDNNPQTNDVYTLPYRLSPSQDHWGYYNGSNNQTIFPYNPPGKSFHIDEVYRQTLPGNTMGGWAPGWSYWVSNGGNREPDGEAIKAGSLKKVTYPTGGYTEFTFEGHNFSIDNYWPIAGGLRIAQIETNPGYGPSTIKQYSYLNYLSSEKCINLGNPYYTYYWNRDIVAEPSPDGDKNVSFGVPASLAYTNTYAIRAEGSSQLVLGSGSNAVYTTVKESTIGNGYTIYEFSFAIDGESGTGGGDASEDILFPGLFYGAYVDVYNSGGWDMNRVLTFSMTSCMYPYPKFFNNDWRRGHLKMKEIYAENGDLLERDSIVYQIQALKGVPGYVVFEWLNGRGYNYARYYNVGGLVKPIKEVTRIFQEDGSSLQSVKELEYNSTAHKQLTKTRQYSSKDEPITTQYYYPTEYGSAFTLLKDKNILSSIDTRTYRGSRLITGTQTEYNDNGQPLKVRKAENASVDIPFNNQTPYTFTEESVISYNSNHLLESVKDKSGIYKGYIWGYNNTYPIAEVINAASNEIAYSVTFESPWGFPIDPDLTVESDAPLSRPCMDMTSQIGVMETEILNLSSNKEYIITYWEKNCELTVSSGTILSNKILQTKGSWHLREIRFTGVSGNVMLLFDPAGFIQELRLYPAKAQMTTYTYDPLIGMTSQCDANNRMVYYEYDSFGRLKLIRDQDRNVLKTFDYQYKQALNQ